MANPLMNKMPNMGMGGGMPGMNNPMLMMQQFRRFCREMKGVNATDRMQELVKSGKVTQEQVDQAMEMAREMQGMFK